MAAALSKLGGAVGVCCRLEHRALKGPHPGRVRRNSHWHQDGSTGIPWATATWLLAVTREEPP